MKKIFVITSHPIQYQAPLFKFLAEDKGVDLTVYFCWDIGTQEASFDREFGQKVKWDIPLLDGYNYKFLTNWSFRPSSEFWGQINFGIVWEIWRNRPDVVIVLGWNSFTNWLAFAAALIVGTKIFLRGENPLNQEVGKSKWKLALKRIVLKPLFMAVSVFLCVGEENRKFYVSYDVPDKKLFFVPYAVDNDRFIKAAAGLKPKRKELRKKLLNITDDRPVILFLGKLIEKKRPMDLLKAFEMLNTKYHIQDTNLVFVGDGALRSDLETYVKEHDLNGVHFAGFKNQTEIPEYYAMADVFVLPSGPGETWGLVVNEAMCFGLPVIVSDMVGCGPDLVRNGKNGFIFHLGDANALADSLRDVLISPGAAEKFGEFSRNVVPEYSFETDKRAILGAFAGL